MLARRSKPSDVDRLEHRNELGGLVRFLPRRVLEVPALSLQPHVALLVLPLARRVSMPAHARRFDPEHRLGPCHVEIGGARAPDLAHLELANGRREPGCSARSTIRSNFESGSAPARSGRASTRRSRAVPEGPGRSTRSKVSRIHRSLAPAEARRRALARRGRRLRTTAPRSHNVRAMFVHGMLSTRV